MTGASAHGQEPVEDWLAARHRDLCDGLSQFLAPDAGLRETTVLHDGHADLLGALDSSLDTQAGLAAILPPPAAAAPQTPPEIAAAITAADPAVRVALRRNPVILALILGDLTVRALMIANETPTARDLDLAHDLDLALDLARDLGLARDLRLGRAGAIARNLDLARDLARDLVHDRDLTLGRAGALGRPGSRRYELGNDLALALARALARDRELDRGNDFDFDLDLDLARGIARETALVVGRALGVQQVEGLAAALLEGVLDDFTHADLTQADLTGRDLTGVRWSDRGTRWPPGTDVDQLRMRSREVAHGTGVYVIASPGDIDKALHHPLG